jgi:glycerate kinase
MERGVRRVLPDAEIMLLPLADGGDGMLQCLAYAGVCALHHQTVSDALGRPHTALYGISLDGSAGYIEMAQICGLAQLQERERNPLVTTTFGVGEMVQHLLQQGIRHLVIGLGGSATNDGGAGALSALGWQLLDRDGQHIPAVNIGLSKLYRIMPSAYTQIGVRVILAADVRNPLLGKRGATAIFAPQKGAHPEQLPELERNLRRWAMAVHRAVGKKLSRIPGAGAAGGLAFGLLAHFPHAQIVSGAELVMKQVGFYSALTGADLVLTGEGRLDASTLHGKLVFRVLRAAWRAHVPVAIVCGELAGDPALLRQYGTVVCEALVSEGTTREEAMRRSAHLTEEKTAKLLMYG